MSVTLRERLSNYRRRISIFIYDIRIYLFVKFHDRHYDINKHIIISGFYRGGTTWLSETLSKITVYPIIWEPLHRKISKEIQTLGIDWKFSIEQNEKADDLKEYLSKILSVKILSPPLLSVSNLESLENGSPLIFKFCRLNMSLSWFLKNFPESKVIYLIRNPYAVIASQLEHPAWEKVFNHSFPIPTGRYTDPILIHKEYLDSLRTKPERLAADWALDVKSVLENNVLDNEKQVLVVFYEDLLIEPEVVLERIFFFYGLNSSFYIMPFISSKSTTSLTESSIIEPLVQINKWRSLLTETEIENIYQVTKKLGVEMVYEKSDYPLLVLQKQKC